MALNVVANLFVILVFWNKHKTILLKNVLIVKKKKTLQLIIWNPVWLYVKFWIVSLRLFNWLRNKSKWNIKYSVMFIKIKKLFFIIQCKENSDVNYAYLEMKISLQKKIIKLTALKLFKISCCLIHILITLLRFIKIFKNKSKVW